MSEIFKDSDIVSTYTDNQAVNDGTIHKLGKSNHRVTNSLFCAIQEKNDFTIDKTINYLICEILPLINLAQKVYDQGDILKTNYNFKVGNYKHNKIIWYIPNENNGITIMKPEDY